MTLRLKLLALLVAPLLLGGCGHGESAPVPLPPAYPRIDIPAPDYVSVGERGFSVNARSLPLVEEKGEDVEWVTATYPSLGASLLVSLHSGLTPEQLEEMTANRLERMGLNTGGMTSEVSRFATPAGWEATLLTTPSGSPTPVQFLAVRRGPTCELAGGTATLGVVPRSADSIAPVVKMLERDIIHSINALP